MSVSELVFSNEASPSDSPVQASDLTSTHTGLRVYEETAKTNLDRIAGIIGFKAGVTRLGLVQETSRSKTVASSDGNAEETWGVAVRLVVATDKWDADVSITVPAVAASVQLGFANASAAIDVSGYKGDLSHLLPTPGALDVDAYAGYITAYGAIQTKVFGDTENQVAVLLQRTVPSANE
jgi:hypothetical protein